LERTNVRDLDARSLDGQVDLVVADLSFVSLRLVLPALTGLCRGDGDLLVMVKPQFEIGRERLGKNGVVKDPLLRAAAVLDVASVALTLGWGTRATAPSPLPGPAGNVEYFLWLRRGCGALTSTAARGLVDRGPSGEKVDR
jgi:23S rRNA (cytidine1920-2'-O)/16S rRNA (cytidine1409-2'-O)-methyltransferase